MLRSTVFNLVHAASLRACLDLLVAKTNELQISGSPLVATMPPPGAPLTPLPPEPQAQSALGFVYFAQPLCAAQAGYPALWLRFKSVPGRGWQRDGEFGGAIRADVWQDHSYPLDYPTVNWLVAQQLDCTDHAWNQLARGVELLQAVCAADAELAGEAAVLPCDAGVAPNPVLCRPLVGALHTAVVHHRGSGPHSATTLWLEQEMRKLPDIHDHGYLYDAWLEKYKEEHSRFPRDPERSFRQAADSCVRRILGGN